MVERRKGVGWRGTVPGFRYVYRVADGDDDRCKRRHHAPATVAGSFPGSRRVQTNPRRAAMAAASRRFSAPSLPMMLATWNSTVRAPMKSWSAISWLE